MSCLLRAVAHLMDADRWKIIGKRKHKKYEKVLLRFHFSIAILTWSNSELEQGYVMRSLGLRPIKNNLLFLLD
jgi:hypothetical protein